MYFNMNSVTVHSPQLWLDVWVFAMLQNEADAI